MASPPILHGGPNTSADADTISSALGVGEHLSIRIDTMREEAAPRVAVGRGAATDAPAIQITIDVVPPALAPGGNRSRPSGPRNGRGSAIIARSGSDIDSSSGGAWPDYTREMKQIRAEMKGVFEILSLVMTLVVPIAVLVYTQLPDDSPSAQRDVWISLGTVVSLATIGAVTAQLTVTETAAEVASCIGLLATIVLILISGIVLVKVLQHESWAMFLETFICICLLIADIYAWLGCAKRPKDKWLLSCGDSGHQQEGLIPR